jgi:hypothetical protein
VLSNIYNGIMKSALRTNAVLPNIRFFDPKPRFFEKMMAYNDGVIYDVGAGVGQVAAGLDACGFTVVALDIVRRANPVYPVVMSDGTSHDYLHGGTVLLCRPCHGHFPLAVVEQAVACDVRRIIYVGLAKNKTRDLGVFSRKFRYVGRGMGDESESMYVWERR